MSEWSSERRAPPWWPANEPWPPVHRRHRWRAHRSRFVRRAGAAFTLLFVLVALGLERVLSWIAAVVSGSAGPLRLSPALAPIALGVALVVLLFAMRRLARPMADIVGAANRVADGDFSVRLPEHGPPSLRTTARAFNSMTTRLEAQELQRRNLMADIAHELRTPLTVIQGRLEGLIDGVYARDEARLGEVLNDTRMLARLVDDLQTLASAESGALALRREPTDLGVLVHEVVGGLASAAAEHQISVEVEAAKDLPLVDVDPLRVREVITNLLANALRHTPAGGKVKVAAASEPQSVVITVSDSGSGIAPADLPKIFDRFYKGQGSEGSGLGLTISRNLVEAHGGEIRAESEPGRGTTMLVKLPLTQD